MAKQETSPESAPVDEVDAGIAAKLRALDGEMQRLRDRRRELVGALARYKGITVAALRDQMKGAR